MPVVKIFHLSEPRHGWIDITFGEEPDTCTITASDVPNDCLRDLAAALARLLKWEGREVVKFSLEPDFAVCELCRSADAVRVLIQLPDHAEPAFEATFPLREFARRVRFELLRIQSRYSAADGWTQPFPTQEVAILSEMPAIEAHA